MFNINKLSHDFKSILPINSFARIISDKVPFYIINKRYKLNDYKMNKNIYLPIFPIRDIKNIKNIKTLYREDLSYVYQYYSVSVDILYENKRIIEQINLDGNIDKYKLNYDVNDPFIEDIKTKLKNL
jgi:hypothetical protein